MRIITTPIRLAFALLLLAVATTRAESMSGVALVIGQSAYEHIAPLSNPANDARAMVKLLTDLGFDARAVTDRDSAKLRRDLERFAEDAEDADVALIYYSGHGIEAGGENWLLPVDADAAALENAGEALVPLSQVLDELKKTVPLTVVLLDACRTNPFPAGTVIRQKPKTRPLPIGEGGLTVVRGATALSAPKPGSESLGTVIGFAAEPGLPALDGEPGGNSPYARALLRHLAAMEGVEFGQVLRMVTEEVYLSTDSKQRPWVNESLRRLVYFGMAPQEPDGIEKTINGERRQLLLTMADLPSLERKQVEQVALREGVKLDSLYGVLRAMGEERMPQSPDELQRVLEDQAARLRDMLGQRAALSTDNPEIAALSAAADRAIAEGAIQAARTFLDQAVARVEQDAGTVDDLEEMLKQKRIADAAIYAKRADASALAFAFRAAADDYAKAFDLVQKWDEDIAWNYKNLQAEALRSLGTAHGDAAALQEALTAYQAVLDMLPNGDRGLDWARTRNNMAVVLNTIGEHEEGTTSLLEALAIFEETMAIFADKGDDLNWAAAQNNAGNILMALGERAGDSSKLVKAREAFHAALAKRDRTKVPLEWAASQNNIGIVTFKLADQRPDLADYADAEVAYRSALEVFTRDKAPIDWGMVSNNLGNTLNALGLRANDPKLHQQAADAFTDALSVRTRSQFPFQYAATQLNLGIAFNHMARHETGTSALGKARAAFDEALTVFERAKAPLEWASAKNNLATVLQTLGQRGSDMTLLQESADAFRDARKVYRREAFPLDWAMTQNNLGNTLHLMALVSSDPKYERDAIGAYRQALREYTRERTPLQWAMATASLGNALQVLANHETTTASLKEAIELRRAALQVLTADNAPVEWANAQNGLGTCLLNLSTREQNNSYLAEARAAFDETTKVFTREAQPLQWAFAQNNIGDVYWSTAALGGGEPEYRLALERFNIAKEAFQSAGYLPLVQLVDNKIALVVEQLPEGKKTAP